METRNSRVAAIRRTLRNGTHTPTAFFGMAGKVHLHRTQTRWRKMNFSTMPSLTILKPGLFWSCNKARLDFLLNVRFKNVSADLIDVLCLMSPQTLCFRGKCRLTCLYGRVEVMGFTIEEGQQPYQLFSPPSHCPLTITVLGNNSTSNKNKKEGRLEAKAIVRKYLSLGNIIQSYAIIESSKFT